MVSSEKQLPESLTRLLPLSFAVPRNYKLELNPDYERKEIDISGKINFEVIKALDADLTSYINMSRSMKIHEAAVLGHAVTFETAEAQNGYDYSDDVRKYSIPETIRNEISSIGSKFDMDLKLTCKITDDLEGVYFAYSNTKEFGKLPILTTQLESHFARKVFPCIDEPSAKATFDFSIIANPDLTVLFNTIEKSQETLPDGKIKHVFETTPILSTYLIAFCIGKFDSVSTTVKNLDGSDILVECIAPIGNKGKLEMPLHFAKEHLITLMESFGPFPINRVAHIGIPDFRSGAMENNGLITYRESMFLVDENSAMRSKQIVSSVICHEISHHYFGNFVTMKWWEDLWLNESFATLVENYNADLTHKRLGDIEKFEFCHSFMNGTKSAAINLDSKDSTHSIKCQIDQLSQIQTIFDEISYNKGGCVIYQLMKYMGEEEFFKGIRHYLQKFANSNADNKDLWDSLSESSGKNVSTLMDFWISTPGLPCIDVALDRATGKIQLTQHQYQSEFKCGEENSKIWPIPFGMIYRTASGKSVNVDILFDKKTETIQTPLDDPIESLKINTEGRSFFIYNPDSVTADLISNNFAFMDTVQRTAFFSNLKFLMQSMCVDKSGKITQRYSDFTIKRVLELIEKCKIAENDFAGRCGLVGLLHYLYECSLKAEAKFPGAEAKVVASIRAILDKYPAPSLDVTQFQKTIEYNLNISTLDLYATVGHEAINEKLRETFDILTSDDEAAKSAINEALYRLAFAAKGQQIAKNYETDSAAAKTELDQLMDAILSEIDNRIRLRKLMGILKIATPEMTCDLMATIFKPESKLQDTPYYPRGIANPKSSAKYLEFILENCQKIIDLVPSGMRIEFLKGASNSASEESIALAAKLKCDFPKFVTEGRIHSEVAEYITLNLRTAQIFGEQIAEL